MNCVVAGQLPKTVVRTESTLCAVHPSQRDDDAHRECLLRSLFDWSNRNPNEGG